MTLCELASTYVHHLDKPENMAVLKAVADDKDKSVEKLAKFALWLINTLRPTEAWGKPKTNMMLNELIVGTKASINKAKSGKISAYRFAGMLINKIRYCRTQEAHASRPYNPGLPSDFAEFEEQLVSLVSVS